MINHRETRLLIVTDSGSSWVNCSWIVLDLGGNSCQVSEKIRPSPAAGKAPVAASQMQQAHYDMLRQCSWVWLTALQLLFVACPEIKGACHHACSLGSKIFKLKLNMDIGMAEWWSWKWKVRTNTLFKSAQWIGWHHSTSQLYLGWKLWAIRTSAQGSRLCEFQPGQRKVSRQNWDILRLSENTVLVPLKKTTVNRV